MTPEWEVAAAAIEEARTADKIWFAGSEARVARLKHAAALERAGRQDEADRILAEVRAEQEQL
jgi:hypothetical protein